MRHTKPAVQMTPSVVRVGLFIYFLLPLLFFIFQFRPTYEIPWSDVVSALQNSFVQSLTAAGVCVLLGAAVSFGLFSLSPRLMRLTRQALLLPQILPVFFSALIVFSVCNPFPLGFWGIVILFVTINLGLASVLIHQAAAQTVGPYAVVSQVFALGRLTFLRKVWWPLMRAHLLSAFMMIFVFCFCSFSVPIIAGGGRSTNFEMLIYEKIFIESNWSLAATLCVIQVFLVTVLSLTLIREPPEAHRELKVSSYIQMKPLLALAFVYLGLYWGAYIKGVVEALTQFSFLVQYREQIADALIFSFKALAIFTLLNAVLLYAWLYDYVRNGQIWHKLIHFISTSTLVMGFSFYLIFALRPSYDLIKLVLAASILFFITLLKVFLQKPVESLRRQIQVAQIFGLKPATIIFEVILRQLKPQFLIWFFVISLWFLSDYAVSKAVGLQTLSLGTLSESFLTSYRMQLAYAMTFLIFILNSIFVGLVSLGVKGAYVAYKKSAL